MVNDHERHVNMPPFYMCTRHEAEDRMECLELSPFEYYRAASHDAPPPRNTDDRDDDRAAAGGGREDHRRGGAAARGGRHPIARRPTYDPRYVVKKYRRSAAGGGTSNDDDDHRESTRTIEQLDATMDYLLRYVFVHRAPPIPTYSDASLARDANEIDVWGEEDGEGGIGGNFSGGEAGGGCRRETFGRCDAVGFVDDRRNRRCRTWRSWRRRRCRR